MLTRTQRLVLSRLAFLTQYYGYPPTIRELSHALGLSDNGAADHVRRLVFKGYARKLERRTSRNTVVTDLGHAELGNRWKQSAGRIIRPKRCAGCDVACFAAQCPFCGLPV